MQVEIESEINLFGVEFLLDGVVDAADYTLWRDNLGAGSTNPAAAVPEPGACLLCLAACFGARRTQRFGLPTRCDTNRC